MISAPPPQDLWISFNNATNDPQDQGNGRFLIVPSPSVNVINAVEDWEDWEDDYSVVSLPDLIADPWETSRPGTPLPGTPGDDDDFEVFISRPGDDMEDGMVDGVFQRVPVIEDLVCVVEPPPLSRPIFMIEEDEEELPPLDDWYTQYM